MQYCREHYNHMNVILWKGFLTFCLLCPIISVGMTHWLKKLFNSSNWLPVNRLLADTSHNHCRLFPCFHCSVCRWPTSSLRHPLCTSALDLLKRASRPLCSSQIADVTDSIGLRNVLCIESLIRTIVWFLLELPAKQPEVCCSAIILVLPTSYFWMLRGFCLPLFSFFSICLKYTLFLPL